MAEKRNGSEVLPEYLRSLVDREDMAGNGLALDWESSYPCLRRFLVGDTRMSGRDQGTKLVLSSDLHDMRVVVQTTLFGYEATYRGKSIPGILETIENDLALGNVPWEENWQRRKAKQRRIERDLT